MDTVRGLKEEKRVLRSGEEERSQREDDIYILLTDGSLQPVQPGGMVELALKELGARLIRVESGLNPDLN
ncbi:MAG: hypothetical protein P8X64_10460 [Anaerolineales bacterium]